MNSKLAFAGLCCLLLITACSSPPKLAEAKGDWEEINPPAFKQAPTAKGSNAYVVPQK